jgi:hypothetical protein
MPRVRERAMRLKALDLSDAVVIILIESDDLSDCQFGKFNHVFEGDRAVHHAR